METDNKIAEITKLFEENSVPSAEQVRNINLFELVAKEEYNLLKFLLHDYYIPNAISINDINNNGNSLLHEAVLANQINIVELIINSPHYKIDLNIQNFQGETALFLACFKGYLSIVKLLLHESDININLRNKSGYSSLHIAVYCNWHEIVCELLLTGKADPNNKTLEEKNCLDDCYDKEMIEMIKRAGGISANYRICTIS